MKKCMSGCGGKMMSKGGKVSPVKKMKKGGITQDIVGMPGYNARTEQYENLISAGVIDPKKVSRVALENAASIGGMILTTECVLSDIKEPNQVAMPNMNGMM
jgi:chaperonin GroEL (HSP60 family)